MKISEYQNMSVTEKFKLLLLKLGIIENEIVLLKDQFFSGKADECEKDLLISRAIDLVDQWNLNIVAIFEICDANPDHNSPASLELQKIELDFRSKYPIPEDIFFPEEWGNILKEDEVKIVSSKVRTPASREEIVKHIKNTCDWDDGLTEEMHEKIIELLVDEAFEKGLSIEEMKRNSPLSEQLIADYKEAVKNGQPPTVTKVDAKTGEKYVALNCGTYKNKIPDDLILLYDFYSALFRLSKDRKECWISFSEVCDNIENTEYIDGWYMPLYQYLIYAASEKIIEPKCVDKCEFEGMEFRLVRNQKTAIIKKFIDLFHRPQENLNGILQVSFLGEEKRTEVLRYSDDKWMLLE